MGDEHPPAGKAQQSSISLQLSVDRSYPPLLTASQTGRIIPTGVVLAAVDSTGQNVLQMALTNVQISSLSIGGAAGGGGMSASMSIDFQQERTTEYYQVSGTTHPITSCWSYVNNITC